ncbi:30S ribosomal protein S12 methylthiotransferase RimO [Roseiconus lacunae]|uniref:Ribosomal protein uS12 methylthiotransferase RimO n=1 Tax=Roseiconus lacunae TaxID=2605694 RepID=A0ABT7PJ88_9BACT|nr:30S ribosomal protein S12 methylthiotransferase RimO [Roseiconus lacunae]MCD0461791.1 30S ribosomal protein S12 methylthiotransferase RimO [Roseiconus lacunae]MDM4016566.1 30S ribosomal protein S12 methylthiotransferase RimO [Roseiconus lacunae]WRQ49435.1 30S ribosomal protein S12 methylthiotransferase RimO [Stieleria sp. HD01]
MELPIVNQPESTPARASSSVDEGEARGKYAVVSLGCPKNLVDTEQMLGRLDQTGYRMVGDVGNADFVVVNTCGFIDSAREESLGAIDEMLALKREGKIRGVVVTGCLAERGQGKLLEARPEIDAMVGVFGRNEIVEVADRLQHGIAEQQQVFRPAPIRPLDDGIRSAVTPRHFAYLKISEGCDRLCTFCAIPKMRGKHYSKPIEQVISEAKRLGDSGVREIVIVAQDTTYYGKDLYGEPRLADLLAELDQIESVDWIRLMYFYPMYIDDRLIDTLAGAKRIVPYIDMPLQHASDRMLKRMSRKTTRQKQEDILGRLRGKIDSLVMRTTMITGFPGETDADFAELMDFVDQQQFQHLGVFTYSVEEDTPAARLPNRVPAKIAERRQSELMALQQSIAFDWNASRVGTATDVIVDSPLEEQPGVWIGRSRCEAPEIDGVLYLSGFDETNEPSVGDIIRCEIVASQGYDLVAAPV